MIKNISFWCSLAVSIGLFTAAPLPGREFALEKSVVLIFGVSQPYDYRMPWKQAGMQQGMGSGFVVAGNRILTNAHNVSNARYVEVRKQNMAQRYVAQVVFIGHDCDLAILQVKDASFYDDMIALELGGIPKVNSTVQTYGFPVGGRQLSVTEGVVSRVQMDFYSHSGADSHLVIQTDAAINPGNSGGPVLQENKVVGVAFQGLRQADNIGYMIPTTVIRHFLADIEDGKYHAYGSVGFAYYSGLHSQSYKEYLQVPAPEDGVVVTRTLLNSSVENVLRRNDVVTKIDDYNVDNDGMVRIYGLRVSLGEVVEQKQIGESLKMTFYRKGKQHNETVTIALNRAVLEIAKQYDDPPDYVVFAGLTFVPLTRNLLETWGANWPTDLPNSLRFLLHHSDEINKDRERKEYVILSAILPDEINSYCNPYENMVLESINDQKIMKLADVSLAINKTEGNFLRMKFMGKKLPLVLEIEKAKSRHEVILQNYEIPSAARMEGQS